MAEVVTEEVVASTVEIDDNYSLNTRRVKLKTPARAGVFWISLRENTRYTTAMRLPAIQTANQQYGLLQLDHAPQLAESLGLDWEDARQQQLTKTVAELLMELLSKEVSGVVVNPVTTFSSILKKNHQTGLLLSLEQQPGAVDPFAVPALIDNWGVEHVRNNYGLAKLELYYHPSEQEAIRKKQLVAEINQYCQMLDISFLLELRMYAPTEAAAVPEKLLEAQIMALEDMRESCDVIALEYPTDTLSAVTLTAELDIPWLVTSHTFHQINESPTAPTYEAFKEHLRAALESGARGYLIDEVLWKDSFSTLPHYESAQSEQWLTTIKQLITTTIRDRVVEVTRIVDEAA